MIDIQAYVKSLAVGEPVSKGPLTMVPLLMAGPAGVAIEAAILDEALARGEAQVTEISDAGSVPELRFLNRGLAPVLLLDGEELVGAKQNRMLNLSVLAPGEAEIVIPVSCVEAGRWQWRSRNFGASDRTLYARLRRDKMAAVSENMALFESRQSDQGQVWDQIAEKSARMGSRSRTGAAEALFEDNRSQLDDLVGAMRPAANQIGAVFLINGSPAGVEVIGSAVLFAKLLPKIARGYALDAIDTPEPELAQQPSVLPLQGLDLAALVLPALKEAKRMPAIGLGEDIRYSSPHGIGAALVHEGKLVHLSVFPVPGAAF